jgi:hypothetical protein
MATTWLMTLESDASPLRRRRALLLRSAVLRRISTTAAATRNLVYAGLPLPPCSKPFGGDRAPLAVDYPARAHTYHTRTGAIRTFQGEPAEESSAGLKLFRKCDVQIDQTSRDGSHSGSRRVALAVQAIDLAQGQRRNDENARALVVALRLGPRAGSFGARCAWCRWRRRSRPDPTAPHAPVDDLRDRPTALVLVVEGKGDRSPPRRGTGGPTFFRLAGTSTCTPGAPLGPTFCGSQTNIAGRTCCRALVVSSSDNGSVDGATSANRPRVVVCFALLSRRSSWHHRERRPASEFGRRVSHLPLPVKTRCNAS